MSIATVVLAAGASTRMGRPKQLLEYKGETLVRRAAREALAAGLGPVIVVVGSGVEGVMSELDGSGAMIAYNARWQEGMGTGISVGVRCLRGSPAIEAVVLTLCDLPGVDVTVLKRLAEEWRRSGSEAAACRHGEAAGVPAVFGRRVFDRLENLPPEQGARALLNSSTLRVAVIGCPGVEVDIDTPEDFARLAGEP